MVTPSKFVTPEFLGHRDMIECITEKDHFLKYKKLIQFIKPKNGTEERRVRRVEIEVYWL